MNRQGIIYTIIFTFIVSFFFIACLALANEFTWQKVELNQDLRKRRAVLRAFGIEVQGTEADYELYEDRIREDTPEGDTLFEAQIEGGTARGIQFSGSGLWGTITGVIAVRADFSRVVGLDIIGHNETPGLGGRIDEPWFKDQFEEERIPESGIKVKGLGSGDQDKENGRVDAIAGASRTSQAVESILNKYLQRLQELRGAK